MKIDLALCGHTHGGQVNIPYLSHHFLPINNPSKYLAGLIKEPYGYTYVNRGIGTLVFPFRFCAPPEITYFKLNWLFNPRKSIIPIYRISSLISKLKMPAINLDCLATQRGFWYLSVISTLFSYTKMYKNNYRVFSAETTHFMTPHFSTCSRWLPYQVHNRYQSAAWRYLLWRYLFIPS